VFVRMGKGEGQCGIRVGGYRHGKNNRWGECCALLNFVVLQDGREDKW